MMLLPGQQPTPPRTPPLTPITPLTPLTPGPGSPSMAASGASGSSGSDSPSPPASPSGPPSPTVLAGDSSSGARVTPGITSLPATSVATVSIQTRTVVELRTATRLFFVSDDAAGESGNAGASGLPGAATAPEVPAGAPRAGACARARQAIREAVTPEDFHAVATEFGSVSAGPRRRIAMLQEFTDRIAPLPLHEARPRLWALLCGMGGVPHTSPGLPRLTIGQCNAVGRYVVDRLASANAAPDSKSGKTTESASLLAQATCYWAATARDPLALTGTSLQPFAAAVALHWSTLDARARLQILETVSSGLATCETAGLRQHHRAVKAQGQDPGQSRSHFIAGRVCAHVEVHAEIASKGPGAHLVTRMLFRGLLMALGQPHPGSEGASTPAGDSKNSSAARSWVSASDLRVLCESALASKPTPEVAMSVFNALSDFAVHNLDMLRELYEIFLPAARAGRYEVELLQAFKAVFASDAFRVLLPSRVLRSGEQKSQGVMTIPSATPTVAPATTPAGSPPAMPALPMPGPAGEPAPTADAMSQPAPAAPPAALAPPHAGQALLAPPSDPAEDAAPESGSDAPVRQPTQASSGEPESHSSSRS